MVKEIIKDEAILKTVSVEATRKDMQIVRDLEDTLKANSEICVGLAANMIGENKRIMCIYDNTKLLTLINAKMIGHSAEVYQVEEGCLSLEGERQTNRYKSITVKYYDKTWKAKTVKFSGFTAEIIQHQLDHFEGILI